ncbi:MAG: hypothetical protein JWQ35_693 [Bacteriovoracaceae bacterium]|nr:hypothetical protein [Bacteriovoracaceae bacterium]
MKNLRPNLFEFLFPRIGFNSEGGKKLEMKEMAELSMALRPRAAARESNEMIISLARVEASPFV